MKKRDKSDSCLYFDITSQERDSAIRYLLGAIITSRQKSNFPSNCYVYDEDVNIYLAHLLFAVSLPEYHEMAEPYLSLETSDVLRWVRATEDRTLRYFIFKVNADHFLIHTSVFEDLPVHSPHKIFKRSEKYYREVAKLYYDQAAAYHKRIYRKKTGVGEVLEKLSRYYDSYQQILVEMRREYFCFLNSFRDQAFRQFMKEIKTYEKDFVVKNKMDSFLDFYAQWLETRDVRIKPMIVRLAAELKQIDPEFRFDSEQLQEKPGDWDEERKSA